MEKTLQSGAFKVRVTVDADGYLTRVHLPAKVPENLATADLAAIYDQLEAFPRHSSGDTFRGRVWKLMSKIPWGQALTYQELAAKAGSPNGSRAVGQACAKNPLPLIVPCHRVLANEGLGGYAYGLEWKSALLALETEARPKKG